MTNPTTISTVSRRVQAFRAIGLVAALVGAALLTAGCSGSQPSAKQASASRTFSAAEYKYAGCMRAHGLANFPWPTITDHEGQQVAFMDPSDAIVSSPSYAGAGRTCAPILPPPVQDGEAQP